MNLSRFSNYRKRALKHLKYMGPFRKREVQETQRDSRAYLVICDIHLLDHPDNEQMTLPGGTTMRVGCVSNPLFLGRLSESRRIFAGVPHGSRFALTANAETEGQFTLPHSLQRLDLLLS